MTTPDYKITLDAHRRGTTFRYYFTLENSNPLGAPWVYTMFDGGLLWTLRTRIPVSTVLDDTDAGVIAQASLAAGQIIFSSPTAGMVLLPASTTKTWPVKTLPWDLQGTVLGTPNSVFDIAAGELPILGDVTRT